MIQRAIPAFSAILLATALAACNTTEATNTTTTASAPAAVTQADERAPFVGVWVGQLREGSVEVRVPATGQASYRYQGRRVPTVATRVRGNRLVLPFARRGQVSLTREGGEMVFRYNGRDGQARTVMARRS